MQLSQAVLSFAHTGYIMPELGDPQRDHHGADFPMQLHKVSLLFIEAREQELLCPAG